MSIAPPVDVMLISSNCGPVPLPGMKPNEPPVSVTLIFLAFDPSFMKNPPAVCVSVMSDCASNPFARYVLPPAMAKVPTAVSPEMLCVPFSTLTCPPPRRPPL